MGQPKLAVDVKLFAAITFRDDETYEKLKPVLEQEFGPIEIQSAVFEFIYTQYYSHEMGFNLRKQLLGFKILIAKDTLADIKLRTNAIEADFTVDGKRSVNIDPGYLTGAKVVLATTKNFDHRVYLGKGIYGDIHLRYRHGKFLVNDWTYPDYREMVIIEFLARLRKIYMKEYECMIQGNE
ncbi:MAG: DUF4416 family protein [Candidatus Zhuqueibacterota bacterium]